jgi:hypothetical protein
MANRHLPNIADIVKVNFDSHKKDRASSQLIASNGNSSKGFALNAAAFRLLRKGSTRRIENRLSSFTSPSPPDVQFYQ